MGFQSAKLKTARKHLKMNMQELADLLGITQRTLSSWESGAIIPKAGKIRLISEKLNIPISYFSDADSSFSKNEEKIEDKFRKSWFSLLEKKDVVQDNELNAFFDKLKKNQNDLINSTIMINAIMTSIDVGIYIKNYSNKYMIANSAFLKMFSIEHSRNLENKNDEEIFSKQFAEENMKEDYKILSCGISGKSREISRIKGTSTQWFSVSKYPIRDAERNIIGLIAIFSDITEYKQSNNSSVIVYNTVTNIQENDLDLVSFKE